MTRTPDTPAPATAGRSTRRRFLAAVGATAGLAVAGPATTATAATAGRLPGAQLASAIERRAGALAIRRDAAFRQAADFVLTHPSNGDEARYLGRHSFSKGLPHAALGEPLGYGAYLQALRAGEQASLDTVALGGDARLANPLAALAFHLEGQDSHGLALPPPPALASAAQAREMIELYWRALARDIPFAGYAAHPLIGEAAAELGVDRGGLFRGETAGDRAGPFVSQFLFKPIPFGALALPQACRVPIEGADFMTRFDEHLRVQNGLPATAALRFETDGRFIRNGRDLAEWVRGDFSYQAFLAAAQILLGFGPAALAPSNPYRASRTQGGFVTFGGPHVLDLVARVAILALKAAWFHKWLVHRRLRPEELGGRVEAVARLGAAFPFDRRLLDSLAAARVFAAHQSYLLPQAYPAGAPLHPAYPAGHAAIAGAAVTVLKAMFDERFPVPAPVEATADGRALRPVTADLDVGGELNKLAANISLGRDFAGVHYRSDGIAGMRLGEQVAISVLADHRDTYREDFAGFRFTGFDGRPISI